MRRRPLARLRAAALAALVAGVGAGVGAGCHRAASARPPATGAPPAAGALVAKAAAPPPDALARVVARLPQRTGTCAQVKSMPDRAAAEEVAQKMEKALQQPVDLVKADLGARGVWWRICAGDEAGEARLVARATRWTAPGGPLDPFLDPATDGAPRFFVLSRETAEKRTPSEAQAKALLSFALVDKAPVILFGTAGALLVASTATAEGAAEGGAEGGGSDVVAVDQAGQRLALDPAPAPGCAACELALQEAPVTARRAVAAGDVATAAGEELLVEEDTAHGVTLLSVLAAEGTHLRRVAALVLDSTRPGFLQKGTVSVVDTEADPHKEIVLRTSELVTEGDAGCALAHKAALFHVVDGRGLVRIDPLKLPPSPPEPVINAVTALDAAGDHAAASKVCAATLAATPQADTAQLCLQRVRRLQDDGALVEAVNAAGLLSASAPSLRPLVSAAFLDAATALDKDPRLVDAAPDCKARPLLPNAGGRALDDVLADAEARAKEQLALADVDDAVLVTGARDFGTGTPVGAVTGRWLVREKTALPARWAAVQASLLPPQGAP